MRIAIFTDTYIPDRNGVSFSIDRFTKMMADDGHQIMIFCPKVKMYIEPRHKNIIVKRYRSITAPSYKEFKLALPFIWTTVRELKKFDPDIVHVQTPLGIGWMGIWATKILKLKNIQTYHTYIPEFLVYLTPGSLLGINKITDFIKSSRLVQAMSKHNLVSDKVVVDEFSQNLNKISKEVANETTEESRGFRDVFADKYTRIVYNRADLVLTPSMAMKNALQKQGVSKEVKVVSNGVDYNLFKKKTNYKITKKFLHMGRLGYEKSVNVIIDAFDIALKKDPELRLDIYGSGPAKKSLQILAKKYGISNKIHFFGPYDINKLSKQLCNYDFFITASTIETQGIVILEAMSAGLPVLGVNGLAVPEVVIDGKNGYISEPFDAVNMADNILKIVSCEKTLENFSKQSLKIAKTHEISECKDYLLNIYKQIANDWL